MASNPLIRDTTPQSGYPGVEEEKRRVQSHQKTDLPHPAHAPNQRCKMATHKRIILAVLFGMLVTFTLALGPRIHCLHNRASDVDTAEHESTLSRLLDSASPEALHKLLHDHLPEKYKHGVFPTDRDAVQALHDDHAELATSIAQLAKRQNNGNSTADPTTPSTPNEPEPTAEPSEPPTEPPTTEEPPPTSRSRSTPNPPRPTPTPDDDEPASTTTPRKDSTSRSRSSTVHISTSTDANGDVTIVTSTSFYDVMPEPTGSGRDPSLQGAAPSQVSGALPALIGAVAGALFLL